jgi:SAM domain (Sterile alpha motif)
MSRYSATTTSTRRCCPAWTAEDLKDLGVTLVGDRRRLLQAIASLREEGEVVVKYPEPARSPKEAERRQLSVVFVDLVGFLQRGLLRGYRDSLQHLPAHHELPGAAVELESWENDDGHDRSDQQPQPDAGTNDEQHTGSRRPPLRGFVAMNNLKPGLMLRLLRL